MRVIFLDIDGVLNGGWDPRHGFKWRDVEAVATLNHIVLLTGASIVISSSWRCDYPLPVLKNILCRWGVAGDIIDTTPVMEDTILWDGMKANLPVARIREIRAWLNDHPEVTTFMVLDDMDIRLNLEGSLWEDELIESNFFKVEGEAGLRFSDIAKILTLWDIS